ncbi:hypothetical protein [Winogradskyella bathintestinalis]|uniref:Uncharacterized protein n=1 Tax=Winogradskyella bathintestinalis TaxID=3035208 RepID=A0ABT7ZQJ6_9FLAO|nr:hypothetical protein [Winogradskyella bathintestinalis]MDN3491270.1 hypothetical protein [Winogradskyella bathintestinalis]
MKKKKPPFTIGEQYELHEFELEDVETVIIGKYEYDVYRCSKKLCSSLDYGSLVDMLLFYNADILAKVVYKFEGYVLFDSIKLLICNKCDINYIYDREANLTILEIKDIKHKFQ